MKGIFRLKAQSAKHCKKILALENPITFSHTFFLKKTHKICTKKIIFIDQIFFVPQGGPPLGLKGKEGGVWTLPGWSGTPPPCKTTAQLIPWAAVRLRPAVAPAEHPRLGKEGVPVPGVAPQELRQHRQGIRPADAVRATARGVLVPASVCAAPGIEGQCRGGCMGGATDPHPKASLLYKEAAGLPLCNGVFAPLTAPPLPDLVFPWEREWEP